jgi:hypothetical protein
VVQLYSDCVLFIESTKLIRLAPDTVCSLECVVAASPLHDAHLPNVGNVDVCVCVCVKPRNIFLTSALRPWKCNTFTQISLT